MDLKPENFLNYRLFANPLNWLTLAVWLFAIAIIAHSLGLLEDEKNKTTKIFNAPSPPSTVIG